MGFRRFATGAALAIAGLAAAVGIGLFANTISGDSVGLGAEPLSAGETLAPAIAKADPDDNPRRHRPRHRRRQHHRGGDQRGSDRAARPPADAVQVQPTAPAAPTVTTFDDHGADSSGGGSGDDRSTSTDGSGSGGSGSIPDEPESSDGSDDPQEIEDD